MTFALYLYCDQEQAVCNMVILTSSSLKNNRYEEQSLVVACNRVQAIVD